MFKIIFSAALLALNTSAAKADWVGSPFELSPQTSGAINTALDTLHYPTIEGTEELRQTGVTPEMSCTSSTCTVIVLSKDIAAKECASFNPIDSYTRIDVALSKDESAAILQRYQQGEFQATDGHIAVGSYCGGLILDCASDASGCTAQLYTF